MVSSSNKGNKVIIIMIMIIIIINTVIIIFKEWEDDRLVWDPATKDDIDTIFAKPSTVWKPELLVDNS